jgi:ABC-type multidrug transport system fused ATPase/permease subunit
VNGSPRDRGSRLIAAGTHAALLESSTEYRRLFARQKVDTVNR